MSCLFAGRRVLLCAVLSVSCSAIAQEPKIQEGQRELAADMLQDVHKDVKSDYYDPKFHGVDIEARYKQAGEFIKSATSFNQAMGAVAWYLEPLNDSHTFFVPPTRAFHLDYGWRMRMVGDDCLITAVKPGTDAEKQGLRPGEQVPSLARITPDRSNLKKLEYLFGLLRPQPAMRVVVRRPGGEPLTLDVQPEIVRTQQLVTIDNFWKEVVDQQLSAQQYERHSYSLGKDVLILKLPAYLMNEKGADAAIGEAAGYKTLVLDLRNNCGGRTDALEHMVGSVFDHDVTIGALEKRRKTEEMIAKGKGAKAFSGKLIVLVDGESEGRSELFARVVQLEKRGTALGDRSAGMVMEAERRPHRIGFGAAEKVKFGPATNIYYGDSLTIA